MYCFFCNSCFSQYDTRCVCEKLIDKILSVSRETQYFSVFFLRAFGKFSCEIRIKNGFLLFGSMRGVCLYFVAQCAFVPTHTVLAKCFSACLLISMVCSAVFARFGWLNRFGTADRGVFCLRGYFSCSRAYPAAWPNSSARQPALMSVGFVVQCFCWQTFLCVLLSLMCSAPQLPRFVVLVDSFLGFELAIR